ncbi:Homoserine kinase [Paenibacillus allorhizosphaerae]|uniref:Homoserine kinase n=2 Tax=Paenibacillus allorhizosphaerae TaxID=2849866 RepID=A0ABN7TJB5_9BACL|nr:Homoserine kinase [Paenibacillus allorhizosphaerae]
MTVSAYFPTQASILSNQALETVFRSNYSLVAETIHCHLYRKGMHDTYVVKAGLKQYYLKIYYCGLRTLEEIEAEVSLLHHLKKESIRVVDPVVRNNGSYVLELKAVEGIRFGVLYDEVEGEEGGTDGEMIEKLGTYIASIHNAFDKITVPVQRWHLDCASLIDHSMQYLMKYANTYPFDFEFLNSIAAEAKRKIEADFTKTLPTYGLCHGDIYGGNIRFDHSGNPIIFDFDLSGYGWRAYDISLLVCRYGWGVDREAMEKRERRKEAFLSGYTKDRSLSAKELDSLYIFAVFRRIFNMGSLYAFFAESWGHDIFYKNVQEEITLLKDWVRAYNI